MAKLGAAGSSLGIALILLASSTPAGADLRFPIPGGAVNPTTREECRAVSNRWSQILKELHDRHEVCLQSSACKNSGYSSGYRSNVCSCAACHELHVVRDRYSSGDLAQMRRAQEKECDAAVTAYQDEQRRQRQAMEEAQRRQRQAYEDAQRQYNESLRQQQNNLTQAQRENQRRLQANMQEQQRLMNEGQNKFQAMAQPAPTSVVGKIIASTESTYKAGKQAKDMMMTTINAINAIWGSGNVKSEARSSLLQSLAEAAPGKYGDWLTPKRNDYNDPGFDAFFDRVKPGGTLTSIAGRLTGATPNPVIGAIQEMSAEVLRSQLQQTLGDIDQVQRQIATFGTNDAPANTYTYTSSRSTGASAGYSGSGNSGGSSMGNESNDTSAARPETASTASTAQQSAESNALQSEFDSVRLGLGVAVLNSGVDSPPLRQLAGLEPPRTESPAGDGSCDYLSRPGRGRHANGQSVCHGGNMMLCSGGNWQAQGSCAGIRGSQSKSSERLER